MLKFYNLLRLRTAECKLSTLEPKAELAYQLQKDILNLKDEIARVRAENSLLADSNELQAQIIKSRAASPAREVTFRSTSPVREVTFRSTSPVHDHEVTFRSNSPCQEQEVSFHEETVTHHHSRPQTPCSRSRQTSPYHHNTISVTTHHRSVSPPATLDRSRPYLNQSCGSSYRSVFRVTLSSELWF